MEQQHELTERSAADLVSASDLSNTTGTCLFDTRELKLHFDAAAQELIAAGNWMVETTESLLTFCEKIPDTGVRLQVQEAFKSLGTQQQSPVSRFTLPTGNPSMKLSFILESDVNRQLFSGFVVPVFSAPTEKGAHDEILLSVIDNTTDYVFIIDLEDKLVVWNKGFENTFYRFIGDSLNVGDSLRTHPVLAHQIGPWMELFELSKSGERHTAELTLDLDQRYYYTVAANPVFQQGTLMGIAFWIDDITEKRRVLEMDELERRVLSHAMQTDSLEEIMYVLCSGLEELAPALRTCVTQKDYADPVLMSITGLSLPAPVNEAFKSIPIGPDCGSCGTAAFTGKPTLVSDISTSSLWTTYKDIVLLYGLKACMSFPVVNNKGRVMGTIGAYLEQSRPLTTFEFDLLNRGRNLAAIVMDKFFSDEVAVRRQQQLSQISKSVPGVIWELVASSEFYLRFTYLSRRSKDLIGVAPEELYGDFEKFMSVVHDDDRAVFIQELNKALEEERQWTFEFRVQMSAGVFKWFRASAQTMRNDNGSYAAYGVFFDIDDLKQTEDSLKQKEREFSSLVESIDDILIVVSKDRIIQRYFAKNDEKLFVRDGSFINKAVRDVVGADVDDKLIAAIDECNATGAPAVMSYHLDHPERRQYYTARVGSVRSKDETENTYFIVVSDVTGKQDMLRLKEHLDDITREAATLANLGVFEVTLPEMTAHWTDQVYRLFDVDKSVEGAELTAEYMSRLHEDDKQVLLEAFEKAVKERSGYEITHRINHRDGSLHWLRCIASVKVNDNGEAVSVVGLTRDITDEKLAEETLMRRERIFSAISDISLLFLQCVNGEDLLDAKLKMLGEVLEVNRVSYFDEITLPDGRKAGCLQQEWTDGTVSASMASEETRIVPQEGCFLEWQNRLKNGEILYLNASEQNEESEPFFSAQSLKSSICMPIIESGEYLGSISLDECRYEREWKSEEISALKSFAGMMGQYLLKTRTENELRQSEALHRSIISTISEGLWMFDMNGTIVTANHAAAEILEKDLGSIIGHTLQEASPTVVDGSLTPIPFENLPCSVALNTHMPVRNAEAMVVMDDGRKKWVQVNSEPVRRVEDGVMAGVVTTFKDVTAIREAELEAKKLSLVARHTSNGIIILNANIEIEWVNDAFMKISGYTLEEIKGKKPSTFMVGDKTDKEMLNKVIGKLANGESFTGELINYRKSGEDYWVYLDIQPIFDNHGKLVNYISVETDITMKKRIEEQVLENLHEKELLLAEVHHRVKNNLAIISSLLQLQKLYTTDAGVKELFQESQNRLRSMALVHEKMYKSNSFSKVRVDQYIHEILEHINAAYPNPGCVINLRESLVEVSAEITTAIPLGLIINEALTNAFKYAFRNRMSGEISVSLESDEGLILLSIEDNGVGLPKNVDPLTSLSIGFTLIRTLAKQLKGEVEFGKSPHGGVMVTLSVPKQ